MTSCRLSQFWKQLSGMVCTAPGKLTRSSIRQSQNTLDCRLSTVAGIVMAVSWSQPSNMLCLMVVRWSGHENCCNPLWWNAASSTVVTCCGMVNEVNFLQ